MAQKWSKEIVARRIRVLRRGGKKLNSDYVQKHDRPLYLAAYKYWGGWRQAIEGAGLSYDTVRVKGWRQRRPVWSKRKIIAVIRKRYRNGEPLNSNYIQTKVQRLYGAANKYFGGWAESIAAAGLDYASLRMVTHRSWSKVVIVGAILQRVKDRLSINGKDVYRDDPALYTSARRHFGKGGWARARRKAGFTSRSPWKWGRENVVREIQRRHQDGLPLNTGSVYKDNPALHGAGRVYFGSWEKAVRVAGFDYSSIRKSHPKGWWTETRILNSIRQLERSGVRLSSKAMQRSPGGLFAAAVVRFGSWSQAVEAAGIPYRAHCLNWSTKAWMRRLDEAEYKKKISLKT